MTQDEMDKWTEALRGQALTWEQTMFAVSLILEAIHTEREACAVIAETPISGEQDDITMEAKDRVAKAIRARNK